MQYLYKYIPIIKDFLKAHKKYVQIIGICIVIIIFLCFLVSGPSNKKNKINVDIPSGLSLMQISELLKQDKIIRSEEVFRIVAILLNGENNIKAGPYLFDGTDNVFKVVRRIINADYGVPVKKITIIEGMRGRDLVNLFGPEFINLNKVEFEREVLSREGYLFPDTYFIPYSASTIDIIKMLEDNFLHQTSNIDLSNSKTSKDLNEIITMASIIEGEASNDEDRKMIADILWRRISIGMPLQVDTVFMFINGKASSEITKADLKIDSPYNTYINKDLPPTPISNPGILAINASMFPTTNKYLYYLSDKNGVMHYAVTFAEHKKNKEKYLR